MTKNNFTQFLKIYINILLWCYSRDEEKFKIYLIFSYTVDESPISNQDILLDLWDSTASQERNILS